MNTSTAVPASPIVNEAITAEYIGMSISFLRQSRMDGRRKGRTTGPSYIKIGRAVRYLISDLDAWLEEHRIDI
jgi:predicted DNA-binding transcriptional regulator AlpA